MRPIYLYAELLLNIRQVTVLAILPTACHQGTHIRLLCDQKTIHLEHEDQDASIELPCQVANTTGLAIPPAPTKELSFRLAVSTATNLPTATNSVTDVTVPWSASKLTTETRLACQSCGNILVPIITVWKDLPSGGWADMMDFWHCHKPANKINLDDSTGSTKGYAAANDLGPTSGVGLVDISHFLFAESDCVGIQVCDYLVYKFLPDFNIMAYRNSGIKKEACSRFSRSHSKVADTTTPE